jgi:hypothetical protein
MSEAMHSPLPPSKTQEEQAAEILALLEEIVLPLNWKRKRKSRRNCRDFLLLLS